MGQWQALDKITDTYFQTMGAMTLPISRRRMGARRLTFEHFPRQKNSPIHLL